ncbi:MAG: type II CAAX endopeptidase family protein [Candidatus Thalassarchaeaceae archaeon]|nr:type II CAAX endopeptidase family protein [Candidatus Thalassarchaeaceae archaeon]HJM77439.1 type II CAAX endopeptidase family protein [Candidatus Thalassarchaeaceae archaeon]
MDKLCVNERSQALVAIALVGFAPSLSIIYGLSISEDELYTQAFFMACKAWILIVPTLWYLRIEGNELSRSLPDGEGLRMGAATGLGMSVIIMATWLFLGDSIDASAMIAELRPTGLVDKRTYVLGALYWIFMNSLLEEYVFRWFITTKGFELFGGEAQAIALSALMFTLHHALALHLVGFVWWQTVMASIGLLGAAAIWSWLYMRHRSIWVCWLSHAICDVVVFYLGYLLLFT